MKRLLTISILALSVFAGPAWAQQRPLQTEDPETIGAGRILLEAGLDYERDVFFPLSGLRGNLFTAPSLGVSIGVSSIAEIQVDGGFYQQLRITEQVPNAPFSPLLKVEGQETSDVDDLDLGAKVRFLSETAGRPAMAVRFSTRLPNANNESGLGKDLQDFTVGLLMAKTVQSVRVVANMGFLILSNPTQVAAQDDLLTYNLSVARAISASGELVGEFAGRANFGTLITPGAEGRGLLRFGARYTWSGVRVDAGVQFGLTSCDPAFGFTGGLTWVFNAFKVP